MLAQRWRRLSGESSFQHAHPTRSVYSYLKRLHRRGLVDRGGVTDRRLVVYRISQRGRERRAWLNRAES